MKNIRSSSSFSVIRTFVSLSLLGIAFIPLIGVELTPSRVVNRNIFVAYTWPNASAKAIDLEVTSKLEGLFSLAKGFRTNKAVSTRVTRAKNSISGSIISLDLIGWQAKKKNIIMPNKIRYTQERLIGKWINWYFKFTTIIHTLLKRLVQE